MQVAPAYRRQGVGRAIVAEARRQAADLGRNRLLCELTGPTAEAFATEPGRGWCSPTPSDGST